MIDPTMSAAVGAFTGAAVNNASGAALNNIPTWIKVTGLIALIGIIIWWYFIAQEKHRTQVRRATRRR